jgi:hypothetical protein
MEAERVSETSANLYQITRYNNQDDVHPRFRRYDNLKSCLVYQSCSCFRVGLSKFKSSHSRTVVLAQKSRAVHYKTRQIIFVTRDRDLIKSVQVRTWFYFLVMST